MAGLPRPLGSRWLRALSLTVTMIMGGVLLQPVAASAGTSQYAWAWDREYYQGGYWGFRIGREGVHTYPNQVHSLINHTWRPVRGLSNPAGASWTFAPDTAWPWIGLPFDSSRPLRVLYFI